MVGRVMPKIGSCLPSKARVDRAARSARQADVPAPEPPETIPVLVVDDHPGFAARSRTRSAERPDSVWLGPRKTGRKPAG
jgi:hypothetical protein